MSSERVISVCNLSKAYHIYENPQDRLKQILWRGRRNFFREFRALDDVSFEVRRGETVGIIGRNGSGKSTLLQIVCGTLGESGGTVELDGDVAALLELGSGFNPDFTGIENIFLYGQLLGMSNRQVKDRLNDIIEFAGIGDFTYQPVKTYSSGMYVRLAFAVSVARKPDILVVDEALSVGDEAFQRKCFARIDDLRQKGTTVLFVSHAAALVVELCDRALLLDAGRLLYDGAPKETVALYHKLSFSSEANRETVRSEIRAAQAVCQDSVVLPGGGEGPARTPDAHAQKPFLDPQLRPQSRLEYEEMGARISSAAIETLGGAQVNQLVHGEEYVYTYSVLFAAAAAKVQFGMLVKSVTGLELGGAAHPAVFSAVPRIDEGEKVSVRFNFRCLFNPGTYFFNAGVKGEINGAVGYLHRIMDAVMFKVQPLRGRVATGYVNFDVVSSINGVGD